MVSLKDMLTGWRCRRLRAALVDLADGSLEGRERLWVEAHVARCRRCAQALDALRAAPAALREGTGVERDEEEWRRQRAMIVKAIESATATRLPVRPPRLRAARAGFPWSAGFAVATAGFIALVGYYRFQETFRPSLQLGSTKAPVPNDIAALDTKTVVALLDVADVIAPAQTDTLALEDLSESDLESLDSWLGADAPEISG
jgi:anti-sigma factor RsiW